MLIDKYGFTSLDHITHMDNLDSIFKYGLLAHNNPYKKKDISNKAVNDRRQRRENIYGRKIHDYVPLYFNPRNAMMYKNKDENVVVLAFKKNLLLKKDVLFTNKNASTASVQFFHNLEDLDKINWDYVKSDTWYGLDEEVKQTMMAEVLVYQRISMEHLLGIYCKNELTRDLLLLKYNLRSNQVKINPKMFFKY